MTFLGADTEQLRAMSTTFDQRASTLESLLDTLAGIVSSAEWHGPDADAFNNKFFQTQRRGAEIADQIRERSSLLEEESEEQDDASAAGDGRRSARPDAPSDPGDPLKDIEPLFDNLTERSNGARERLDKALDSIRSRAMDEVQEHIDDSTRIGRWAKKAFGAMPFVGAAPDVQELIQAYKDGDTGGVISNSVEVLLGVAPSPAAGIVSEANSWAGEFLPGNRTVTDLYGDVAENTASAKRGEMTGNAVSDLIGLDKDSGWRNAISADLGAANHFITLYSNPIGASYELGTSALDLWR